MSSTAFLARPYCVLVHKHYLLLFLLVPFLNLLAAQVVLEVDLSNILQAQQGTGNVLLLPT